MIANCNVLPRRFNRMALLAVFGALVLRASTLELPDLIDSTEGRYASVAYEMFHSRDYLTPQIPVENHFEPYLGKPPLQFWLMAAAYRIFGVDEWTSRLPSFIALCLIVLTLIYFTAKCSVQSSGPLASLFAISSPLLFFFSGAAVLDVTLTASITVALVTFYLSVEHLPQQTVSYGTSVILFWIVLGLGFLIKGPVVIAYVALTGCSWIYLRRGLRGLAVLRRLAPIRGVALLLLMVCPWFIMAEVEHDGFFRYFFVNENMLRFFTSSYGDRYGQGHVVGYGAAWVMFFVGFLPWSIIVILHLLVGLKRKELRSELRDNPYQSFCLAWLLSPLVFLTFMKQLHPGYVLPAIPGAALYLAHCVATQSTAKSERDFKWVGLFGSIVLAFLWAADFFGGSVLWSVIAVVLAGCFLLARLTQARALAWASNRLLAPLIVVLVLTFVVLVGAPISDGRKSTENILLCVAEHTIEDNLEVGVRHDRSYSARFLTEAWASELPRRLNIRVLSREEVKQTLIRHLVLRTGDLPGVSPSFKVRGRFGDWLWLIKSEEPVPEVTCRNNETV